MCIKGSKEDARTLNVYLEKVREGIRKIENDFLKNGRLLTALSIRNRFLGKDEVKKSVLEVFDKHNLDMEALVGIDYSTGTLKRFKTTRKHISSFMLAEYGRDDMYLTELNHKFATDLEHYFKTKRKCNHNSTLKYIRNFRKIVNIAVANDWLQKDPFINYNVKLKEVIREPLTKEELQILETKELPIARLEEIRDVFVFCCYTGLSYVDVERLTKDDLQNGIDGNKWIFTYREKTKTKTNIPLLPKAKEIIKKYEHNIECKITGRLLPVKSNQKTNAYLKEIAVICGIEKNLTFHMARHTFATTVTLTNNVPIETVSKILGHKNIRTTQIYAKIVDSKVSKDMNTLMDILEKKSDDEGTNLKKLGS